MGTESEHAEQAAVGHSVHPLRLIGVLLLGSAAAVARIGFGSLQDLARVSALLLLSMLVICLLQPGSLRVHRPRTLLAVGLVAVLAAAALRFGFVYPFAVVVLGTTLSYGTIIRWSLPVTWPQRETAVAGLALGPLLASMLLWYRAPSLLTFLLLSALTAGLLEMYARAHRTAHLIDSGVARAARGVGQGVTAVLATAIMLFLVIPLNWISRLFGYSPLDGGWATRSSAWVDLQTENTGRSNGGPEHAQSMAMREPKPTKSVRRRGHLRLLAPTLALVVVALLMGVGPVKLSWADRDQEVATQQDRPSTFTRPFEQDPAFKDAPWAQNLRVNLLDAWNNLEFNAAVGGWSLKDVSSQYINVRNGERASTQPDPALGDPLVIWFFGGSAAFGAGQRDEHTIPSELVKLAQDQGVALEIHNFAVPATVNWQSAMLLIAKLQAGEKPDLVVIYDGANDVALQGVLAAQGQGASTQPASLIDGELDAVLSKRATAKSEGDSSPGQTLPPSKTRTPDKELTPAASGQAVLSRYSNGIEVIRKFSELSSVPVLIFWQPDLRAKTPQSGSDADTLAAVEVNEESVKVWTETSDAVRAGLGALGVTDLSAVFDGQTEPIYWDTVHTNELGSKIVAERMLKELQPTLQNLQNSRG